MNGKILILEDRVTRQKNSLDKFNINLEDYDFLDNKIKNDFEIVFNDLNSFLSENTNTYDGIIAHESKFRATENDEFLRVFCNRNKIKLIYYSGGIGSTFYNTNDEILYINSNELYSEKLTLFLDDYKQKLESGHNDEDINLLLIAYGKNWEKNIFLNAIERLNIYLYSNINEEIIEYDDFKKKTYLDIILKNNLLSINEPKLDDGLIITDIKLYVTYLKKEILKKVTDGL